MTPTTANGAPFEGSSGSPGDPLSALHPRRLSRALTEVTERAVRTPVELSRLGVQLWADLARAQLAAGRRYVGSPAEGPVAPAKEDRRFNDVAFQENPFYFFLQQQQLLLERTAGQVIEASVRPEGRQEKARFFADVFLKAVSPTHHLLGNPAALKRAFDTGGRSVVKGMRNVVRDAAGNGGWPRQVDTSPFRVGENLAATPGAVVYRNRIMEIIHYAPQVPETYAVPMLFCPPWINKYYIMDLAPKKSLIEWALQHGHNCFAISYRNPDASMRDISLNDYLFEGPLEAFRVVARLTGSPVINTLSVCLGGTLTAMALAYLAATGEELVQTATFLNSHTDFRQPGILGVFTDEATVRSLERRMAKKGYLEAKEMTRIFDLIRSDDLIFNYVVNNWLLGEDPPAFDLLAWNNDSTRMPERLHLEYLRACYGRNEFAEGRFLLGDHKLDPHAVKTETYVLSAIADHIVPWESAYRTARLLGGRNRFVLSTSGHIAGIVNPPSPKAKHWVNDDALPADPTEWLAGATLHDGTWWEDWATWTSTRAGPQLEAPSALGSKAYPPMEAAPGTYVHG